MTVTTTPAQRTPVLPTAATTPSLLDRLLPRWDATRIERRVIDAPVDVVYSETLHVDFLDAARTHRLVHLLFAMRSLAERVVATVSLRRSPPTPPVSALRLIDLPRTGEWVALAESPPHEIVFGAIGRFWAGETRWSPTDGQQFEAFDVPGFAKIGCNFVVRRLDANRAQLTYEARTCATSPEARRAFRRYWLVVSPFVGIIMRATLSVIAQNAAERLRTST
ncbi:MAG: hypothetical protein U0132_14495 [Gemmatimonadaceae bacterium]